MEFLKQEMDYFANFQSSDKKTSLKTSCSFDPTKQKIEFVKNKIKSFH